MTARTYKLTLAYDGTDYAGWQSQPSGNTLQDTLEAAFVKITGESIRVVASGRTDAGVHALGQVVSFDSSTDLPLDVFHRAINARLPDDMAALDLSVVPTGFHARRDAIRKRYRYTLCDSPVRDVFLRRYAWHVRWRLDVGRMQRAAALVIGTHDFRSFETTGSPRDSTVRTVYDASVRRTAGMFALAKDASPLNDEQLQSSSCDQNLLEFEIEANGFLYNMVRAITGTLVEIGRGAREPESIHETLIACDRAAAGPTAPPQGLALVSVHYEPSSLASSTSQPLT